MVLETLKSTDEVGEWTSGDFDGIPLLQVEVEANITWFVAGSD